jgi:hypothetical protein
MLERLQSLIFCKGEVRRLRIRLNKGIWRSAHIGVLGASCTGEDVGKKEGSRGKSTSNGKKRCLFHPGLVCPNANGECIFTGAGKVDASLSRPV